MTDLIESWESDALIRGMVPETIRGYRWSLRNFEKFVKASRTDLARADKMILRAYIEDLRKRDLAPRTISLRIGAISHLFEFMIFEGLRETNPVIEVRKRYLKNYKTDGEQHERKLISIEEAARMVNACVDVRDKAILLVLFKTGIRRGELLSLELEDINLQEQSILL
ncbi:MAG: site-specific integrase, partial [Methanothrix sp.]|nr:site-specific integrase [Methanothrix sp.]